MGLSRTCKSTQSPIHGRCYVVQACALGGLHIRANFWGKPIYNTGSRLASAPLGFDTSGTAWTTQPAGGLNGYQYREVRLTSARVNYFSVVRHYRLSGIG